MLLQSFKVIYSGTDKKVSRYTSLSCILFELRSGKLSYAEDKNGKEIK